LIEFLASLPCVIYQTDADLTVRMVSPNIVHLIGIRPECLQGNRSLWQDRLYHEDRNRLTSRLAQLTSGESASENHRITNDERLPVWVCHSFRKVGKGDDTCIRGAIIPISTDVWARSLDSGIISQFVHKIGNHFQLINLVIGSLKRNGVSSSEIDLLQETVDHAVEFTRAFSQYSQVSVRASVVNLGEILRSVIHNTAPLFEDKNVTVKTRVDDSLDHTFVSGDPVLLELAFTSILENALDATKSGDHVSVDSKKEVAATSSASIAWISITDTGCGMERETLAKASAPFFSTKPERNGLGLSMSNRILEMHGGMLSISSIEEQGTRVDIALPVNTHSDR
jgi:signal transduction histidine kinase